MFQCRDENLISLTYLLATIRLGHQIDRLCGSSHKDDLTSRRGSDELLHLCAALLIRLCRLVCQRMSAAMNVGVITHVKASECLNNLTWFLCGRRIIQPE